MEPYLKEEVGKKRHFKVEIIISSCRQWEQYSRAKFEKVGNKGGKLQGQWLWGGWKGSEQSTRRVAGLRKDCSFIQCNRKITKTKCRGFLVKTYEHSFCVSPIFLVKKEIRSSADIKKREVFQVCQERSNWNVEKICWLEESNSIASFPQDLTEICDQEFKIRPGNTLVSIH